MIAFYHMAKAQNEFITTWKPSTIQTQSYQGIPVNSTATQIWLPTEGSNYTISWEEIGYPAHSGLLSGTTSAYQVLIDFGTPLNPTPANATYRVKISNGNGTFYRIRFRDYDLFANGDAIIGDIHKILSVEQWGQTKWHTMHNAFSGCKFMNVTATDLPQLSDVTDLSFMFEGCETMTGNPTINNWNISSVTSLTAMFSGCFVFNQPLENWDTSNVVSMGVVFLMARSFNQPLAAWNTSKVETMTAMFNNAREFNQPIGNWDLSHNLDCEFMFSNALKFNQPIGNWNTSEVIEMNNMFTNARAFNQDISGWDTSKVITMQGMFYNAEHFNQPVGNWNTAKVTQMQYMFRLAKAFNQDIGNWDTSKTQYMTDMFNGATAFDQDLSGWNTSQVNSMDNMFSGATRFNQSLGSWNLNSLYSAFGMFAQSGLNCQNYDSTLLGWSQNPATPGNIHLGNAAPMVYSHPAAVAARNQLINNKNWTISGDTYNGQCESFLATADLKADPETGIYPNPASDFIMVKNAEVKSFMLYDTSGRLILKGSLNERRIDIRNLASGNYLLQLFSGNNVWNYKFIKR